MKATSLLVAFVVTMTTSLVAAAQPKQPPNPADAAYKDIKATFGSVPTFFKAFPEDAIAAAWAEMKSVQLDPATSLTPRMKELIGLAVAAQIPCRYCVYFHTQAARANGATDRDIKEAIAVAGATRHWSTILFGAQTDEAAFNREVAKIIAHVKEQTAAKKAPADVAAVVDGPTAMKDMEAMLGVVPSFVKALPPAAMAPAWRMMRMLELGVDTSIAPKDKDLIGLAVAAQVPCKYCVYFHTEAAKLHGATESELREAVAMAAVTRLWSTILNGSLTEEPKFRAEVDQIMERVRRSQKAARR